MCGNPLSGLFGGHSPSPPQAPDPNTVANAQSQANINAAQAQQGLNEIGQSNPFGSMQYVKDPTTGQVTLQVGINPNAEAQLQASQFGGAAAANAGANQVGNLFGQYSAPINFGNVSALNTQAYGGPIQGYLANSGQIQGSIANNGGQLATALGGTSLGINGNPNIGNINSGQGFQFNTNGLPNLGQNFGQQAEQAYGLALGAQLPVLNQLQGREQEQLNSQLAGEGFTDPGAAGYQNAQHDLALNQGQQYNQLANQAFGAGLQAQGQLFGENLGSRQQLFGEQATQAQNQLQQQQLSVQAQEAQAQNQLAQAAAQNAAQQQQFQQGLQSGQFQNQALGQQFGQNLAAGQYGLGAQGQQFGQNLAAGQYGLGAQSQQFGQNLQNAQLGNQASQQQLQQDLMQRQYPLQEMQQLFGFNGGAQMPQFNNTPQAGIQAPNIGQFYYNNLQNQQDIYNQQQAGRNANTGGILNLFGGLAQAVPWASMFGAM